MALTAKEMMEKARQLPIPTPWDLDEFLANIAQMRGRKIHRIASDLVTSSGSPCGLWLVRPNDDVIIHEASTTTYHIDQICRHEIGHMILGHDRASGDHGAPEDIATSLHSIMPAIELDAIRSVLTRRDFATDQEREAELLASMIEIASREKSLGHSMMHNVFFRNEAR